MRALLVFQSTQRRTAEGAGGGRDSRGQAWEGRVNVPDICAPGLTPCVSPECLESKCLTPLSIPSTLHLVESVLNQGLENHTNLLWEEQENPDRPKTLLSITLGAGSGGAEMGKGVLSIPWPPRYGKTGYGSTATTTVVGRGAQGTIWQRGRYGS